MDTLKNIDSAKTFQELRYMDRLRCSVETEISVPWGDKWSCKIIDMSERGLGVVTPVRLRKGDMVIISDPVTRARVVWCLNNRAGLRIIN